MRSEACGKPKKELRLRVMAEYASSGIWVMESIKPFRHGMVSHGSLNLPSDLAERFNGWIEQYYDNLGMDGVELDVKKFNAEGISLAREKKAFLGPDVYIEFIPEDENGGLGLSQEIRLDK